MKIGIADLIRNHRAVAASLDPTRPNQNDYRFAALGAFTEISEALQHLPWRPWRLSDQREPTPRELEQALPELADALGALLRCVANLGIDAEAFEQACLDHVQTKLDRIRRQIDG